MTTRVAYTDKYKDIHKDWGLDKRKVNKVLKRAMEQLVNELLDNTPWTLHKGYRDNRTDHEYLFDLLNGRVIEDLIVLWFESRGAKAERVGTDCDNVVVRDNKRRIKSSPDLLVDGKRVEIQVSRGGKRKFYNVKKRKGESILAGNNTLMFIVDNEFFVVDAKVLAGCEVKANGAWGNKECYFIYDEDINYKSMGGNNNG